MILKSILTLFLFPIFGFAYQLIISNKILAPGYTQMIFLCLVLLIFWKLKVKQQKISKAIIVSSFAITLVWFVVISKKPDLFQAEYYLATFSDDLYGKESRRFLQDLNSSLLTSSQTKIYKLNYPVSSYQQAVEILGQKKKAKILIWGNQTFLNLVMPPPYFQNLRDYQLIKDLQIRLKLITEVPMLRIYQEPNTSTIGFTAALLAAIKDPSELRIRSAGAFYQVWHSSIHLAYLRFKLANYLFLQMLSNSETWQDAEFKCILKEYQRAAFYLRKAEHPELAAAINNNQAILKYLRVVFKAKRWSNRLLLKLKVAKKIALLKNPLLFPYQSAEVANWNLKILKKIHQKTKAQRQRKHEL